MMDVRSMRQVVDVLEAGSMPLAAEEAVRRWCGEPSAAVCVGTLAYVRSSANHVFRFSQQGAPRFLRLSPASERRPDSLAAELAFVLHLAHAGIPVARPLPSAAGALTEEVSAGEQRCYAVVFEGLRGAQFELEEMNAARMHAWGRALARVHRASERFAHQPARPTWQDEIRALVHALPPDEAEARHVLTAGLAWLNALPTQHHGYGLIHGDFELDNLVWDGEQPQALDFDSAVYTLYVVDIAVALQDVWQEGGAGRDQAIAAFLEGYATERPVPDGTAEALPRVLNLIRATKFARMLRAYASVSGEDGDAPAWFATMRDRHQRWLAATRAELNWT